jgi:multidrug efflux pump subunit AcrA (membrane-fusion protein)
MTSPMNLPEAPAPWVDDFDLGPVAGELPARHRRRWRWLVVPAVALVIIGAAAWIVHPLGTTATSLVTAPATTGTIVSSVSLSGSVASSTVDELSFGSSGSVTAVNVAPGDTVTVGQVLATIDDSTLQGQLATAQANLVAAEARLATDKAGPTKATKASAKDAVNQASLQLSTARQSLSDTYAQNAQSIAQANAALSSAKATLAADSKAVPVDPQLIAKDKAAVSSAASNLSAAKLKATLAVHQAQSQVSSARLGLTSAKNGYTLKIAPVTAAQIASDKAAVASAKQALSTLQQTGAQIISPIAGTVTAVTIKVGDQVSGSSGSSGSSSSSSSSSSTSTGQIQVMDLAHLEIAGQASETDVPKLKMGQAATISAAALGTETAVGKVCALSNVGTQISGVTSFGATVCLDAANPSLLVGMSATAAVVTNRIDNAVLVPSLAVKTVGGQQVVTVLGADGTTQTIVPVTTGISNGSETEIVTGLQAGATVVESLTTTTNNRPNGGGGGRGFPGAGGFGG